MEGITIEKLPLEVLQQIFILSENPDFARTSRTFRLAATAQSSVKAQWLVHKYSGNYQFALCRGLRYRFFTKEILAQLDAMYYQSQLRRGRLDAIKEIPFEKRRIEQRLFKTPDPDGSCFELVKILLQRKASPDEPNGYPLCKSAQLGRVEMVKLLLEHNANALTQGSLALLSCVKRGNLEIAKLLLEHHVVPNAEALKIAHTNKNWEMQKLLSDYGATPDMSGFQNAHYYQPATFEEAETAGASGFQPATFAETAGASGFQPATFAETAGASDFQATTFEEAETAGASGFQPATFEETAGASDFQATTFEEAETAGARRFPPATFEEAETAGNTL